MAIWARIELPYFASVQRRMSKNAVRGLTAYARSNRWLVNEEIIQKNAVCEVLEENRFSGLEELSLQLQNRIGSRRVSNNLIF